MRRTPFAPAKPLNSDKNSIASNKSEKVALIVASQTADDTTWLHDVFREWKKNIYVIDDPNAELTVPANKGREGMVYLTYIIDNYDMLPEFMIFQHANRYQWHNDDPLYDGIRVLSKLRLSYVREQGYVNLRCVWTLGCPSEIHPFVEDGFRVPMTDPTTMEGHARAGWYYKQAFEALFPGTAVPDIVGAACCAQFAVTANKVRQRPKQDYERCRNWLLATDLRDDLSGIVLECMWHIIFGKPSVHCPSAGQCYCNVFGMCDLQCESEGVCSSQYTLPRFSKLPTGWPEYGWDGYRQNASAV